MVERTAAAEVYSTKRVLLCGIDFSGISGIMHERDLN